MNAVNVVLISNILHTKRPLIAWIDNAINISENINWECICSWIFSLSSFPNPPSAVIISALTSLKFFVNAVNELDYTVIMGLTVFYSGFTILIILVNDLLLAAIDPRIRLAWFRGKSFIQEILKTPTCRWPTLVPHFSSRCLVTVATLMLRSVGPR